MEKIIQKYSKIISVIILTSTLTFYFLQQKEGNRQVMPLASPSIDYWKIFSEISQESKFVEKADTYYNLPVFTPTQLDLNGKEIVLSGYYLPYSQKDSVIIISRYPTANCFFCGGAGVESVAMVELKKASSITFTTDEILMVKGILELNSTNFEKLIYIIKDASVEKP